MSRPCADCFRGTVHSGIPRGRTAKIDNLSTYIAEPPTDITPKGIIVIIPDVFGWKFNNLRVMSDSYAEKGGFAVYLPDFWGGM